MKQERALQLLTDRGHIPELLELARTGIGSLYHIYTCKTCGTKFENFDNTPNVNMMWVEDEAVYPDTILKCSEMIIKEIIK